MSVLSVGFLFRIMFPNVNVPVSISFSFPCRNWFPGKTGVFSMPGRNSAWLKVKSGKMLCVEQLSKAVLS